MVYYYFICHKRLWYFSKGISMEQNSDLVKIGKEIDENTYSREKKHIMIDETINVDFLRGWNIIHEIKKSDKLEKASVAQIKYYMYILKEKGLIIKEGVIDYPTLRKRTKIYLTPDDEKEIEEILEDIEKILSLDRPPKEKRKGYCSKCSYYELCFV